MPDFTHSPGDRYSSDFYLLAVFNKVAMNKSLYGHTVSFLLAQQLRVVLLGYVFMFNF